MLKAGVLEDGLLRLASQGTPQGRVISPVLANIFLQHVVDEWFEHEAKIAPRDIRATSRQRATSASVFETKRRNAFALIAPFDDGFEVVTK